MGDASTYKIETLCLHAGQEIDASMARAVPLHRTSSYLFRDTEHAANLFALKELGNIYTRLMNPTQDVLEKRMAALEGGAAALAVSSGTAAVHYAIINICQQGDEIVSANDLYGGTYTMFNNIHPQFGVKVNWVDGRDPENYAKAITPKTRAIFCETVSNPALNVTDMAAVADIAKAHGVPLIVDSTFTTPYLLRPIEHGANIVCHSLTKWLSGHGTMIGGVCVDANTFDFTKEPEKFPLFNEPEGSYHDLRFGPDIAALGLPPFIMRMRLVPLRNLGACISPDNAWMAMQGIETLPLRVQRQCDNAMAVAKHLKDRKGVEWVRYPGLKDDPQHDIAQKYLKNGFGGMVVFGIQGGKAAGAKFIEALKLFSHLANIGDAKSLAIHPASTTHSQLSEEEQLAGGIKPELIRLSIGIENIDDILSDIDQAISAAIK
ncbi:O-acetylhomoserine aminocarboxypropyltransferase/cysteine synthase [Candidatus Sumerlaeota bacterium]|nr:O-acetylhomoserine aminocarboxypropyltransferase/cysteine synthase [Candidatus Sumerlaeota bacterium]